MNQLFADRIQDVPRSFIREILKVTMDRSMICFAGGLPSSKYFPVKELQCSVNRVFEEHGTDSLQYSNSEGLAVLRKVVFVPGEPFYTREIQTSTFRLNFSCVDELTIDGG